MKKQDDLIGTMLGNYREFETLGQGGMARVYKAHQETLGRDVAIKVLPPWYAADRSFIERFNLEARLVARLSHPNIVTVHDANEQNGHLYIMLQLVDGGTLNNPLDQLQMTNRKLGYNYSALENSHNYESPPRPSTINPIISPAIEYIILTALMKNPQQRYQTARDMADTLQKALTNNTPPRGNINPMGNYYGQPGVSGVPAGPSYPRPGTSSLGDNRQPGLYHCFNRHYINTPQVRY